MLNRPTSPEQGRAMSVRITRRWRGLAGVSLLTGLLLVLLVQPALAVVPEISNPGFEQWTSNLPDHWSVSEAGAFPTGPSHNTGTYSVLLKDANVNPASMNATITAGDVPNAGQDAEQYRTYRLAAWVQSDRGAAAPALVMWFTDDANNMIGSKQIVRGTDFGVNQTTWKQMSLVRGAPFGATRVVVQLGMYGGTGLGVRFDDVELDEVSTNAGVPSVFDGWSVWRSSNLGSGFSVNAVTGGLVEFAATGNQHYELNGGASVSRTFGRPVDTLAFHLTTAGGWKDSGQLVLRTWRYLPVDGQPTIPEDQLIDSSGTFPERDIVLSGLNTKRIDYTCEAIRGEALDDMSATISNVKAFSPVWRFRNIANSSFYLWTADESEKNSIQAKLGQVWKFEGPAYYTDILNPSNNSPLWRFRNIKGGYYLYTSDVNEKNTIVNTLSSKWKLEGEAYGVSIDPSGAPVWRFLNLKTGTYLYSADAAEKNNIVATQSTIWKLEGPAYYLSR